MNAIEVRVSFSGTGLGSSAPVSACFHPPVSLEIKHTNTKELSSTYLLFAQRFVPERQ